MAFLSVPTSSSQCQTIALAFLNVVGESVADGACVACPGLGWKAKRPEGMGEREGTVHVVLSWIRAVFCVSV